MVEWHVDSRGASPRASHACPREIVIRIADLRRAGPSYATISAVLNADGVQTPTGRPRWQRSYADRLHTRYAMEIIEVAYLSPDCQ